MKISVSVPGRLHGFDMAMYFQKQGVLNELITGYPKKFVIPFGIRPEFIKSLYVNEIINRGTSILGLGYPLDFVASEMFDWIASKTIKLDSDVYFIWSSYGLRTMKKIRAKNPNAKIIIVRGSAHIAEQEYLLRKINNTEKQQITSALINKEIKEYEAADYITVPSSFAYESFIKRGIAKEKLFLNFLGVNLSQFPFKKKDPSLNEILVIGNVGTLSRRKNVSAIIKVIAKLNEVHPRFKLVLAGQIDLKSFDSALLKHNFIDYKGKLPQHDLHKVYEEIDVFVINSIEEGLAMVQLQAMSSGCPVIATTNTGGTDIVKDYENGIVLPILDDLALENALLWFYNNREKITEMGNKSREIASFGFTWDDFGERNLKFAKEIVEK